MQMTRFLYLPAKKLSNRAQFLQSFRRKEGRSLPSHCRFACDIEQCSNFIISCNI